MLDEELSRDLKDIQRECDSRKAQNLPFAHWVMQAQMEAIDRYNARAAQIPQKIPQNDNL